MKVDALSQLLDVILDDLSARFIINLPAEELSSVTRICFGLEQAHWFYEDFFRPLHPELPSVNLRAFTAALFSHCPLLWKFSGQHEAAFDDFLKYKIRVPVRGAIMLNQDMTKCVLVKGWKASAGWGFPKGKIDQDEDDADCAVREVREECGFDISPYVQEKDYVDMVIKEQSVRLYILRGIPLDTNFEPQTRKEISKIDWFDLDSLPTFKKNPTNEIKPSLKMNKYYMVAPFLAPLRRWIKKNKPKSKKDKDSQATADQREKGAQMSVGLPVQVVAAGPQSTDAASQALKLLMGIADPPPDLKSSDQPPDEHSPSKVSSGRDTGHIDLASLFQKSTVNDTKHNERSGDTTQTSMHSNPLPLNILNTSIEASIMDQLLPAANHVSDSSQRRNVFPMQRVDLNHQVAHHIAAQSQTPLWQAGNGQPLPSHPNFPSPTTYLPENSAYPLQNTRRDHLLPGQMPMRSDLGPPGLQFSNPSTPPPHTSNPNAPSLLALLRPPMQHEPHRSQQIFMHPPPVQPDGSTRLRMPMSQPPASINSAYNPASVHHKQSLLALLKPIDYDASKQGDTFTGKPQGEYYSSEGHQALPRSTTTTSSRDAFLLDYLTQAAANHKRI